MSKASMTEISKGGSKGAPFLRVSQRGYHGHDDGREEGEGARAPPCPTARSGLAQVSHRAIISFGCSSVILSYPGFGRDETTSTRKQR